jgi:RHS repeat-associated protein
VGGVKDASTGLVRLGARDYDPVLQRFTTVDPVQALESPLQWNPYLYADNSPVTKSDSSGMFWLFDAVVSAAKTVVKAVVKVVNTVKAVAKAVVKTVVKAAAAVAKTVTKVVKTVVKAVTTAAKTVKKVVTTAVKKTASTVKNAVSSAGKAVGSAVGSVVDSVKNANPLDLVQTGLDLVGMVPVVGEIADGANALIYAARGDYGNAALSLAAMVPVGGQAATALKLGMKAGNALAPALGKAAAKIGGVGQAAATACRKNSFLPGTKVLMADGTAKPIEDVLLGELVAATDPETGETAAEPVTDLITGDGTKNLVRIGTDPDQDGNTDWITATDGHPFWTNTGWTNAGNLQPGDQLASGNGQTVEIISLDKQTRPATVHNLTINRIHTYYITPTPNTPILTHNCGVTEFTDAQFAKKIKQSRDSQVVKNRGMVVNDYISKFRKGYIRQKLGTDTLGKTVEQAILEGDSMTRKLLTSNRFAK